MRNVPGMLGLLLGAVCLASGCSGDNDESNGNDKAIEACRLMQKGNSKEAAERAASAAEYDGKWKALATALEVLAGTAGDIGVTPSTALITAADECTKVQ